MKVAIVGGGPAGLAAAKAIGKEPGNFQIDLFEYQKQVGGLWNYVPDNKNGETAPSNNGYVTPIYREMETNITKDIMQYNNEPFPEELEKFPTRGEVARYLQNFSKTIENTQIYVNTEVVSAQKSNEKWEVKVHNHKTGKGTENTYDALVVANGHFRTTYFPEVEGLDAWKSLGHKKVIHAKFYDHAEPYRDQRVLVVGNSASGIDISTQVSTVASRVFLSSRKPDDLANLTNPIVDDIGVVKSYNEDSSITLEDGTMIENIDSVIFCTGYLYDVPFLKNYQAEISLKTQNGFRNIHRGIFYIDDPTLLFIALQKQVAPMPLAEAQGVYVARVLSNRLKLPSAEEMHKIEKEITDKYTSESQYHFLGYPGDVNYMTELIDEVAKIEDGLGGHEAEIWDEKRRQSRSVSGPVKKERLEHVLKHALQLRREGKEFVLLREK